MPNPLDDIWKAHGIALDSYSVVRKVLSLTAPERTMVLHGTQFESAAGDQEILDALDAAQDELDDQTVMFLYATFEATLRDHVTNQGALLSSAAQPGPQFGTNLQPWFTELCKDTRMDVLTGSDGIGSGMVRLPIPHPVHFALQSVDASDDDSEVERYDGNACLFIGAFTWRQIRIWQIGLGQVMPTPCSVSVTALRFPP